MMVDCNKYNGSQLLRDQPFAEGLRLGLAADAFAM